jgi:hypothetical protein
MARGGRAKALVVLLAVTFAAASAAGSASAAESGLSVDLNWGTSKAEQDKTAAAVADLGAKWVRLTVQWKYWEPNGPSIVLPTTGSLQDTDRSVQLAIAAGAKVLIDVYNAPDWAATSPSSEGQVPRNASDFANFMRNLAAHYRGAVAAYEIWNEEDLDRFWAGGSDPVKYTSLLKAAYPAIKSADPNAQVVFGGLSWDFTRSGSFLQRAYGAGAQGSFDVLGLHPYPDSDTDPALTRWRAWFTPPRDLMNQYGDDAKPIWLTEFGVNTSTATRAGGAWQTGVAEQTQASMITTAFSVLQSMPYVGVVFYYNLRNNYWDKDNPSSVEGNFGLIRTDFSHKPSYQAFKTIAFGLTPSPLPIPAPQAPANDAFASSRALTGSTGTLSATNVAASKETGEPKHAGRVGGRSVWFTWTSPGTGVVTIDTFGSKFDTVLAVYTGVNVGSLRSIASNDDSGGVQSKVSFNATVGTVYRVAVDGTGGPPAQTGPVVVNWSRRAIRSR